MRRLIGLFVVGAVLFSSFAASAVEFELLSSPNVQLFGPGETFTIEILISNQDQTSVAGLAASVYGYEGFADFESGAAVTSYLNTVCIPSAGCFGGFDNLVGGSLVESFEGSSGARVPIAYSIAIIPVSNPGIGVDLGLDGNVGSTMFELTFTAFASGIIQIGTGYPDAAIGDGVYLPDGSRIDALGATVEVNFSAPDTDGDGIDDQAETNTGVWNGPFDTGTDPNDDDSDDDGLKDGVETNSGLYFGANDTGTNPNIVDSDLDGVGDGAEVLAQSNPVDIASIPRITVEMVSIRDRGNPADSTSFGAVAQDFAIGKYEITNLQYAIFLNSVAISDPRTLWNASMGGIQRLNGPGNYLYLPEPGWEDRAVEWISHWDAARFVNWLENDQPVGPQSIATTEDGTYTLSGSNENMTGLISRAASPSYFLPNEDQWYKAAYYAGGGAYTTYPFQTSTTPTCSSPGATTNTANCGQVVNTITTVGAYTGSVGRNGQFDQGGNVQEWVEYAGSGSAITRGGDWYSGVADMASGQRASRVPYDASFNTGFRVAAATPPSLTGTADMQNPNIPRRSCQNSSIFFSDAQWQTAISCTMNASICQTGNPYCSNNGASCDPYSEGDCTGFACAETLGSCSSNSDCPAWDSCEPSRCIEPTPWLSASPIGVCELSGSYCQDSFDCGTIQLDSGQCAGNLEPCDSNTPCPEGDYCIYDEREQACLPTTCEFSADEDIPQYSWKYDPLRPPGTPQLDSERWTTIIDDPVQSTVDVRDGLPFDPSRIGIGECLFDPATSFQSAVVAFVPQQFDGYQCCIWEAFCPSCGTDSGLFEFKWGARSDEVAHNGDSDGIPTQCGDNCPNDDNPDQIDADGDGVGAACDPDDGSDLVPPDSDVGGGDGVRDPVDNCPDDFNPDQMDSDGDFIGDICDPYPLPEPGLLMQLGIGALGVALLGGMRRR